MTKMTVNIIVIMWCLIEKEIEKDIEELKEIDNKITNNIIDEKDSNETFNNEDIENIRKQLKKFRLEISKINGIPPYYVFNDSTLEEILEKMPKCNEDLIKVRGFGKVKVEKYGENIIEIVNS